MKKILIIVCFSFLQICANDTASSNFEDPKPRSLIHHKNLYARTATLVLCGDNSWRVNFYKHNESVVSHWKRDSLDSILFASDIKLFDRSNKSFSHLKE